MSTVDIVPKIESSAPSDMFDGLIRHVASQPDIASGLDVLLSGLADRIKGTSNDQNIQRLSRAIRAASPSFAAALSGKSISRDA